MEVDKASQESTMKDIKIVQLSANRQIFDDVIACDLWFRPPQSKILATPINWRLPEKLF